MIEQLRARMSGERGPRAIDGGILAAERLHLHVAQVDPSLIGHLEEQQIGDLLDVIAVVDPIVAEGVAEPPEFLDNVGHASIGPRWLARHFSFSTTNSASSFWNSSKYGCLFCSSKAGR